MSKLPATKSRRPLASLNQPAAQAFKDCNFIVNAEINDKGRCIFGNVVNINSDEIITKLLDIISQQTAEIGELTNKVISQASEIIDLKMKLNGLQL